MSDLVQKLVGALEHCEGVFMSHEINHINGGKIEDDALTIIRAALSAAKDGGWLPIETAPKDGTRLILAWGGKCVLAGWLDNSQGEYPWAGWQTPSLTPRPHGDPTAWQPLPNPPKGEV